MSLLDQNEPAQVGGDKEMKVLKEMNAFEDQHEQFVDSLKGARGISGPRLDPQGKTGSWSGSVS